MVVNLNDVMPVGLCQATQELFDVRRFKANFGDFLILRANDKTIGPKVNLLKKDVNSLLTEEKFFEGHKAVIISNIDKILSLVSSRYMQVDMRVAEGVVNNGKQLIEKVMESVSFEDLGRLEPEFKTRITFPVYELFNGYSKNSRA